MNKRAAVERLFPFLTWFSGYSPASLRADLTSGLTLALLLVPQSMAYAQLAGLPAHYGLYAALLPPVIAALFGSSHHLATGPNAVISLMTFVALEPLATAGSEAFIAYAILMSLLVGVFQLLLGVMRLGLLVNLLSHPVVNGFSNGAAIIIAATQLGTLLGIDVEAGNHYYQTIINLLRDLPGQIHWPTLLMGLLAFAVIYGVRRISRRLPYVLLAVVVTTVISWAVGFQSDRVVTLSHLSGDHVRRQIEEYNTALDSIDIFVGERVLRHRQLQEVQGIASRETPETIRLNAEMALADVRIEALRGLAAQQRGQLRQLRFVSVSAAGDTGSFEALPPGHRKGAAKTWRLDVGGGRIAEGAMVLQGGGRVIGHIPRGLPHVTMPALNWSDALSLFPMAIIIALIGFMEAISIARTMATRTGRHLDANQEFIGQGLANMVGSFVGSFPVAGSFARSAISYQLGAASGLSSVFASTAVLLVLLFFTPLFYYVPQSVMAAVIIAAVANLIHIRQFVHDWKAQWYDGVIGIITFVGTLYYAPHLDRGVMLGIGLSVGWYLLRTMKPNVTTLAKHPDHTFRSSERFGLEQCRYIALLRYDGALFFANVNHLEEQVDHCIRTMPELKHIIIMANGINELDASGEETLSALVDRVRNAGYDISLSGLNGAVLDTMRRTGLYEKIGEEHLFRTINTAIDHVWGETHKDSDEVFCPLAWQPIKKLPVASSVRRDPRIEEGNAPDGQPPPEK